MPDLSRSSSGIRTPSSSRSCSPSRSACPTPEELRAKLAAGEQVVVVDLRHPREFEADPAGVPGALRLTTAEVETRHGEIPRDRDVVLYCT